MFADLTHWQIRALKNNLMNSFNTTATRAIHVPIPKLTFTGTIDSPEGVAGDANTTSDGAVAACSRVLPDREPNDHFRVVDSVDRYESEDPNDYVWHYALAQHIQSAYSYMVVHQQSAQGAYKLSHSAAFPDNNTKMSQEDCNSICSVRVCQLLQQAYDAFTFDRTSEIYMTDPSGTISLLKDLIVILNVVTERSYLFVSADDKRLLLLDGILQKWQRMRALIVAKYPSLSAAQRKRYFFSDENMQEMQCYVASSRHFLREFQAGCTRLNGGQALQKPVGILLANTWRFVSIPM